MNTDSEPSHNPHSLDCVQYVESFEELLAARFEGKVNAICWTRSLDGDFDEIMASIGELDEITTLEEDDLESLSLSPSGSMAREHLIADLTRLKKAGLQPSLDCIPAYPRSQSTGPIPVDVYDFHADSATVLADTYLCSYSVACSEGVRNDDAICYVDIPEIRSEVLKEYGGNDDTGFQAFLQEKFYNLHYSMKAAAKPYSFGFGNLWRIATLCPGGSVLPCIHRAPTTRPGDAARLLLIS